MQQGPDIPIDSPKNVGLRGVQAVCVALRTLHLPCKERWHAARVSLPTNPVQA